VPRAEALSATEALLLLLVSLVVLLTVGGVWTARLGLGGIVLGELLRVLLPTLVALQARGVPLQRGLGLGEVRQFAAPIGGALAGAGACWLVGLLESGVIERILPTPPSVIEAMRRLVLPPGGPRPLAVDLFALAIVPALCEETLFRGALVPALVPRGRVLAVAVSAILFGAYHASIYRFFPVTLLGLLLGALRVRSRSLWPSIAFHAANNILVVLLLRSGRDGVPLPREPWGALGLITAIAFLCLGLMLVHRAQPR
jgi:membrane protease YdiL (CAAX protease family)